MLVAWFIVTSQREVTCSIFVEYNPPREIQNILRLFTQIIQEMMPDSALADATLDRLVNDANRIQLTAESMRKVQVQRELANAMTQ